MSAPTSTVWLDAPLSDDDPHSSNLLNVLTGETLISTLTIDINNDGYDDEVIVVRKSNSQNLSIVVAVMEPETGVYLRLPEITTEFTRTRTFSYTGNGCAGGT